MATGPGAQNLPYRRGAFRAGVMKVVARSRKQKTVRESPGDCLSPYFN